jgi:hypothetical protein
MTRGTINVNRMSSAGASIATLTYLALSGTRLSASTLYAVIGAS